MHAWIATHTLALALTMTACREAPPTWETAASDADVRPGAQRSTGRWVRLQALTTPLGEEYAARVLPAIGAQAEVTMPVAGRITSVRVMPGDHVDAGAELFVGAAPELAMASATVASCAEQIRSLEARRAHLVALRAEGLVRVGELTTMTVDIARLRGEQRRSTAVLTGAGLRPDARIDAGAGFTARSPIAGTVTDVRAAIGRYVRPEDGPVVRVASALGTRLEAVMPTMPGASRYELLGAAPRALRLVQTAPRADGEGPGVRAWFELEDGGALPLGQVARVRRRATSTDAALVPEEAIVTRAGATEVWARSARGRPERVPVEVLYVNAGFAAVRGSFPAGAEVSRDPEGLGGEP